MIRDLQDIGESEIQGRARTLEEQLQDAGLYDKVLVGAEDHAGGVKTESDVGKLEPVLNRAFRQAAIAEAKRGMDYVYPTPEVGLQAVLEALSNRNTAEHQV